MDVRDAVVLVTGGASGLGAAVVRAVVAAGGCAVVADLDAARGEALARELGADSVVFARVDVSRPGEIGAAIEAARARWQVPRALVTCAGIVPGARTVGREGPHALELFERTVGVNLVGTFDAIRLSADAMRTLAVQPDGDRGVIVATASIAATEGRIGAAAYAASKAGIVGMTLPVARDLAPWSIRMVTIAPGTFATPMFDGLPEPVRRSFESTTVFPRRAGRPDEFARLVLHAFAGTMLNGTVIRLDGALRGAAS